VLVDRVSQSFIGMTDVCRAELGRGRSDAEKSGIREHEPTAFPRPGVPGHGLDGYDDPAGKRRRVREPTAAGQPLPWSCPCRTDCAFCCSCSPAGRST